MNWGELPFLDDGGLKYPPPTTSLLPTSRASSIPRCLDVLCCDAILRVTTPFFLLLCCWHLQFFHEINIIGRISSTGHHTTRILRHLTDDRRQFGYPSNWGGKVTHQKFQNGKSEFCPLSLRSSLVTLPVAFSLCPVDQLTLNCLRGSEKQQSVPVIYLIMRGMVSLLLLTNESCDSQSVLSCFVSFEIEFTSQNK